MSECNCGIEDMQPNYKKAILEFNTATSEGEHDFEVAFQGQKLATLLYDLDQELRSLEKWGGLHSEEDGTDSYDKFSALKVTDKPEEGLRADAYSTICAVRGLLWRMINNRGLREVIDA